MVEKRTSGAAGNNRSIVNRRRFLRLTGVATAATLAGCSGDDGAEPVTTTAGSDGTPAQTPEGEASEIREKYDLAELDYDTEDSLTIFQWSGYWPNYTVPNFETVFDVNVDLSFFSSNEAMFAKLKSVGPGNVDLVFPSDFMANIMASQDYLQPVEKEKVPNFENLKPKFQNPDYEPDDSNLWSIPYNWGMSGFGVNRNVVDQDLSSWDALWNEEYSGQITMLNNIREAFAVSLFRLGYDINTTDEGEIDEAKEALIEQKDLLLAYDSSNVQTLLMNEEASPSHSWNGATFGAYRELMDDDGNAPIEYVLPEEGNVIWTDTGCLVKDAPNPNAAHAFMNYYTNLKVHAAITEWLGYPPLLKDEREHRGDDKMFEVENFNPSQEKMDNMSYLRNIGDATKYLDKAWTEVKNA